MVITSNGHPIGVLTFASEDSLEDVLASLRAGRAQRAALTLRRAAVTRGLNKQSNKSIKDCAILKLVSGFCCSQLQMPL